MNAEQIKSAVRWVIATFGTFIAGWFAAKGWFTVDQVLSVLNSETVIGFAVSGIVLVWSMITHTKTNTVAVVNAMPEVKGVVTNTTTEGRNLAASVPSPTVVSAGTTAAANLAK